MILALRASCGVCFEPEKPAALVEAVRCLMLLDPRDIQRLGGNAERFCDENLSVKVGVDYFLQNIEVVDMEAG